MRTDLDELNQAIANIDWSTPPEPEIRFYYDPTTRVGIRVGGIDESDPYVVITRDEYDEIDAAFRYYVSKDNQVKRIILDVSGKIVLELSDTGPYRTLKDCMIFADQNGPDVYKLKDPDYD